MRENTLMSAEVVEPYASALMSLADSQNLIERFGNDAKELLAALKSSQDLKQFLANPVIKIDDKKAVLRRITGEGLHQYLVNFLQLVVDKKRTAFLTGILEQFLALVRDRTSTVLAEVTSVTELSNEQRDRVKERVKAMTNAQNVELETTLDPSLIGGVVIKVGSQVLDASLKGQLRRIGFSLETTVS
ncbi:ATP synthase F1 subunit delta [Dactylococcopsis salina]|uniref:ATP synthase subunit delta n=1 Tax=Dactylococcopsis salina (strain PCC 8305) TaxID=13035 RepID=K9Z006_DACS8|nr:ATP synthase F1 subunit delta [Dactylococcopsis salina]AFZ52067.1 ATP synthase, F1 delta subunit [Dactylococcopsis salina PCC 8305]